MNPSEEKYQVSEESPSVREITVASADAVKPEADAEAVKPEQEAEQNKEDETDFMKSGKVSNFNSEKKDRLKIPPLNMNTNKIQPETPSIMTPDSEYEDLPLFLSMDPSVMDSIEVDSIDSELRSTGNTGLEEEEEFGKERVSEFRKARAKKFGEVVYAEPKIPLNSSHRNGFIRGETAEVRIVHVERTLHHKFNPYLYTLEMRHGDFRWVLRRRYHHFQKLHAALLLFKTSQAFQFGYASSMKKSKKNKRLEKVRVEDRSDVVGKSLTSPPAPPPAATDFLRLQDIPTSKSGSNQSDDISSATSTLSNKSGGGNQHPKGQVLSKFPKKPDSMLSHEQTEKRRYQLEKYLNAILSCNVYRNHHETLDFFEVSEFSFIEGCMKGKEGLVKKRTGDDKVRGRVRAIQQILCCCCRNRWMKSWIIIQETCLVGLSPKTGEVRLVLLFDKDFEISGGLRQTHNKNAILLSNNSRSFCFKTWTGRKKQEWLEAIQKIITGEPVKWFIHANRHGSFAPVRHDQETRWFVDGKDLFKSVFEAIEAAKDEIFITDWWLSPEIYLKRGIDFSHKTRLDFLLERKAEDGVKIFILLYKEFSLALGLNSFYTKRALITRGGKKNIKIFRHPDHSGAELKDYLWAHHEKLVIIDQLYAFVGGIDLCYGRWDTNDHPLTDLDAVDSGTNPNLLNKHPGFLSMVPNTSTRLADRQGGTMVLAQVMRSAHELSMAPVRAISNNNNTNHDTPGADRENSNDAPDNEDNSNKRRVARRLRRVMTRAKKKLKKVRVGLEHESVSDDSLSDSDFEDALKGMENPIISMSDEEIDKMPDAGEDQIDGEIPDDKYPPMTLWRGKDYVNFIVKDVARPDQPGGDNVDRRTTPRMPWHDIATFVQGTAARDVARHFIQRWNAIKSEKAKFNPNYPFLLPRPYEGIYHVPPILKTNSSMTNSNVQVLRSASNWSAGIDDIEGSIHTAMLKSIEESEYYIYIENQFFITSCSQNYRGEVLNSIGMALVNRIKKAHLNGETFRVYVLLPLLPAFEGKIGSATGTALRVILHYQYASINRGQESMWKILERSGINPINYISFCSLRTKSELLGIPVTELIYIHSKLMIVDDRLVICGSANINDRSLLGNRDSEVCLLIEDTEFEDGVMNGKPAKVGKFGGSLRKFLMREHLGLLKNSNEMSKSESESFVADPICSTFYKDVWLRTASVNSKLFDEAFLVVPTDKVKTMDECYSYEQRTPLAEFDRVGAKRILNGVKGSLVLLPLQFLENENLAPNVFAKEGLVPSMTWT